METFVKWFVESMSLVRFVSIFLLTGLCYVVVPEWIDARLMARNPEFAPTGTLKFVLFFSGSLLSVYVFFQCLSQLLKVLARRRAERDFRLAEQVLQTLDAEERIYVYLFVADGFALRRYASNDRVVISLLKKGVIEKMDPLLVSPNSKRSYYLSSRSRDVLERWLVSGGSWLEDFEKLTA